MKTRSKIVVIPLGEIDFYQVNKLAANLSVAFSSAVDIVQGGPIPEVAYNVSRDQYYSTVILTRLEQLCAGDTEKLLGVTEEDLYIPTKPYVTGEADPLANVAIVSFYRMRQEFYGLPEDEKTVYSRVLKEAILQLGRLYSLNVCRNPRCVMFRGGTMLEVDSKDERFCDNCQRNLVRAGA